MLSFLSKWFQPKPSPISHALKQGATVVDVRSSDEFRTGSAHGAVNVPHTDITRMKKKLKNMPQPIVVCCASGMRANLALQTLNELGFEAVVNGQTWRQVKRAQEAEGLK